MIVKELLAAPVIAAVVIVEPLSVRSPPLNVTAPEYVCIPDVVTLAPKSEAPDTVNDAAPYVASDF